MWVDDRRLAGSGYPASRRQVEWLVGQGVNRILTLTESPLPSPFTEGLGVVLKHVSMKDHYPPSKSSLLEAASFVKDEIEGGNTVLVHCLAGEGRTGCTLAAYLMLTEGIGPDEAISKLRKIKEAFVERSQEPAVADFAKR